MTFLNSEVSRFQAVHKGRRLEYITVGWNSVEGVVAITSGLIAGSIALIGFGLDSLIELLSGIALIWRLSMDEQPERRQRVEVTALRVVGISFIALALFVAYDAVKSLWNRNPPEASFVGIALAALSLIVMPLLARAKRRVAARIGSRALHADSRQTDICAYLSAILLAGLVLNAVLGWWWSDPVAGLAMVPIITKEGVEALKGKTCHDESCGR